MVQEQFLNRLGLSLLLAWGGFEEFVFLRA
jgi:hypothetical protein